MKKTFSISQAITFSLEAVKRRFFFFLAVIGIPFIVNLVFQTVNGFLDSYTQNASDTTLVQVGITFGLLQIGLSLVSMVLSVLFSIGSAKIQLATVDGTSPSLNELVRGKQLIIPTIISLVLSTILTSLGFISLIIPGIFLIILYQFFMYVIIDTGKGGFFALKRSAEITKGVRVQLVLFSLVLTVVNIIGLLFLGVGMLFTLPMTAIAHAYVYRTLADQTKGDTV